MFWRSLWPAFIWAVVILILCGMPGEDLPELTFLQWLRPDKIVHLILFGVQCYLLVKGFRNQNIISILKTNPIAFALVISISYGAIVEILQTFVFIHRTGDVRDAAANALGAFIAAVISKKEMTKKLNNQKSD